MYITCTYNYMYISIYTCIVSSRYSPTLSNQAIHAGPVFLVGLHHLHCNPPSLGFGLLILFTDPKPIGDDECLHQLQTCVVLMDPWSEKSSETHTSVLESFLCCCLFVNKTFSFWVLSYSSPSERNCACLYLYMKGRQVRLKHQQYE